MAQDKQLKPKSAFVVPIGQMWTHKNTIWFCGNIGNILKLILSFFLTLPHIFHSFDDITVYSSIEKVDLIKLNRPKCSFFTKKMHYLRHIFHQMA